MQTRKMKGLKRSRDDTTDNPVDSGDNGEEEEADDGGVELKKVRV
jgi:ribosome production factor 2